MSDLTRVTFRAGDVETVHADWGLRRPFADAFTDFLKDALSRCGAEPPQPATREAAQRGAGFGLSEHDADDPPPLTYCRVLSFRFAGRVLHDPTWRDLVQTCIRVAVERGVGLDEMRVLFGTRLRSGEVEGLYHVPDVNISHSSLNAENSYRALRALSERLRIGFELIISPSQEPGLRHRILHTVPVEPAPTHTPS